MSVTSMPGDASPLAALCKELTRDEWIAFVKICRPKWKAHQIAEVLGVSRRTVLRSESYRRLRAIDKARMPAGSTRRGRTGRPINPPDERGFSDPFDPWG